MSIDLRDHLSLKKKTLFLDLSLYPIEDSDPFLSKNIIMIIKV